MKKKSKTLIVSTFLVVSLLMVGFLSTSSITAADAAAYPTIIERLSSKFNLNKDDVQGVFEEVRDEHQAQMYASWADRLDDLVSEGKITEEQKQAILDKQNEIHDQIEALKNQNLTPEERKTKAKEIHDALVNWANEKGIDLALIGPNMGFGFRRGFKAGMMWGMH